MRKLLLSFVFISGSLAISAQETVTNNDQGDIIENVSTISDNNAKSSSKNRVADNNGICYGETSKVAFYEVLIAENRFKIELKDSKRLVIRNTEEIISKKRAEKLYSER
ncbi:hypothetical protein ACWGOQ_0002385 [Aquimarina sp. M1]